MAQKNLPVMQETWVPSLHQEDSLEKGKATCSSVSAWRIPGGPQSLGSQRIKHDWATNTHRRKLQNASFFFFFLATPCRACGILIPRPMIKFRSPPWEHAVLTTESPVKSHNASINRVSWINGDGVNRNSNAVTKK